MEGASLDIFTYIVNNFHDVFYSGLDAVRPYSLSLLSVLILLDGTMFFINTMFRGGLTENFVSKLITYGTYFFIISEFSNLIKVILKSFFIAGSVAGGNIIDETYLTTPSDLVKRGWDICLPTLNQLTGAGEEAADLVDKSTGVFSFLYDAINGVALNVIANYILMLLIIIFCMFCFAILAFQITLTLSEFYIAGLVAFILIPFGVFKPFAFMAEKSFGSIVMFGVKLTCIAIVLGIVEKTFQTWHSGKILTLEEAFLLALMALVLAFITWLIPAMVASSQGGAPSLSSGSFVGAALSSVTTSYTMMQMMKSIASGQSGTNQQGTSAATSPLRPTNSSGATGSASAPSSTPQSLLRPKK